MRLFGTLRKREEPQTQSRPSAMIATPEIQDHEWVQIFFELFFSLGHSYLLFAAF
jgi:hypothetical protein